MKNLIKVICLCTLLTACVTGESITNLYPGMSKKEVVQELGRPDSFYKENNLEVFKYTNRLMSGWNWNRADYYAKFENDKLVEYGTQKIREHGNPLSSINIYHTEN